MFVAKFQMSAKQIADSCLATGLASEVVLLNRLGRKLMGGQLARPC